MASTDNEFSRQAIRRTLEQHVGSNPDANDVAATAFDIWQRVIARLTPVIGARGVDALFNRALHLTSRSFPWLSMSGEHAASSAQLTSLKRRLAGQSPAIANEASYALLVAFSDLLASLIGEPLSGRLLNPVWAPPLAASKEETLDE